MAKLSNSVEAYVAWCKLMEVNPSLVENVYRYKNLCERMNRLRWQMTAEMPSGKVKTYTVSDYPYKEIPKILATALDNDIRVRIYRIDPDNTYHLLHDTEILRVAQEEERCFGS